MTGAEGRERMKDLMARFRSGPPTSLGGLRVVRSRDYLNETVTPSGAKPRPLDGPRGDMVIFAIGCCS